MQINMYLEFFITYIITLKISEMISFSLLENNFPENMFFLLYIYILNILHPFLYLNSNIHLILNFILTFFFIKY